MKRSEALNLIANQLDFLNGTFVGFRDNFDEKELSRADVILTTLEQTGMQPPQMIEIIYTEYGGSFVRNANKWETENEEK